MGFEWESGTGIAGRSLAAVREAWGRGGKAVLDAEWEGGDAAVPPSVHSVIRSSKHSFPSLSPSHASLLERVSRGLAPAGRGPSLSQLSYFPGANCQGRSPVGRTPLHVAAAMSRLDCISLQLNYEASINDRDTKGETPMSLACRLNRSQSRRWMFLFYWMVKLGTKDPMDPVVNKAFQRVKAGFGSKENKT